MIASRKRINDQRIFEGAINGIELKNDESKEEEHQEDLSLEDNQAILKHREQKKVEIQDRTRRLNG